MYTYTHALQLNYRANGRRVTRHQGRGAQRQRATLQYFRTQETPRAPKDTRGIQKTPEGPGGKKGDRERHQGDHGAHGIHQGGAEGNTGGPERAARPEGPCVCWNAYNNNFYQAVLAIADQF